MEWINVQAEFESWFSGRKSAFVYQFEDARMIMGVNRSKSVTAHGQPADYIITDRGTTFWAEVKSTQELISFPLANISKAQWNGARQVVAAQGAYFFFIKKLATNTWYRVPASFFVEIHAEQIKSVKWSNLEDFKYVI